MCPAKNPQNKTKKKGKTKNLKLTEFAEFADEPEWGSVRRLLLGKKMDFIIFLYVCFTRLVAGVEFLPGCLA